MPVITRTFSATYEIETVDFRRKVLAETKARLELLLQLCNYSTELLKQMGDHEAYRICFDQQYASRAIFKDRLHDIEGQLTWVNRDLSERSPINPQSGSKPL